MPPYLSGFPLLLRRGFACAFGLVFQLPTYQITQLPNLSEFLSLLRLLWVEGLPGSDPFDTLKSLAKPLLRSDFGANSCSGGSRRRVGNS